MSPVPQNTSQLKPHASGNSSNVLARMQVCLDHSILPSIHLVQGLVFFVDATVESTERPEKPRSARPKKCTETRNVPEPICVLNMSLSEFITAALAAHNFQNVYIPGAASGPGMRISWSGSTDGKSQAPVIQDDQDWKALQGQLEAHVSRPKSKLNTIAVTFDLDSMEGYKNRKRALSPSTMLDTNHHEMEHGSHVPRLDTYSQNQIALLRATEEIKAAWVCEEHAPEGKTGAARFPSLKTAPKKYQNAGLRKDNNVVQKSRNADVFDPFESGGLHDEDITSDRPPLPSSNSRAERLGAQQFPENLQCDRTRRNEVDLSTPWRSTGTSCSLEASKPPKADRGKGQAKRQVISDSDSRILLPPPASARPSARFLEDIRWKVFNPTLSHAFYISDQPFLNFTAESSQFLAIVQDVFNISFPDVTFSLITSDPIAYDCVKTRKSKLADEILKQVKKYFEQAEFQGQPRKICEYVRWALKDGPACYGLPAPMGYKKGEQGYTSPDGLLESDFITPVAQKFPKYAANSAMQSPIDGENPPKGLYALILFAVERAFSAYISGSYKAPPQFTHDNYWQALKVFFGHISSDSKSLMVLRDLENISSS
ncbi:hypothetical protein BDN70DRAFT_571699 [Pholiota conissans]|uniref:Uncharacterized protein n=1 Tax=Pholiota conissans TaxID=109636 RepID=A0A9P6CRT0_9AGAR|nr:hypothetical protein BDN70DRAFT_571699 [Pholiota conissans]